MSEPRAISSGQMRSLVASFIIDTPWDEMKVDVQPFIELPAEQRGKMFATFIANQFHVSAGAVPRLFLAKSFNPSEFLGEGWTIWKGPNDGDGLSGEEDIDLRSGDLTEINSASFIFETRLKEGEKSITGEEKLRRLKEEKPEFIRFGGNVFLGLWEDYQTSKENSILEWLYRTFGITFMDFPGLVLRLPDGGRYVLCLRRGDDGAWRWFYYWLGRRWRTDGPSVAYRRSVCGLRKLALRTLILGLLDTLSLVLGSAKIFANAFGIVRIQFQTSCKMHGVFFYAKINLVVGEYVNDYACLPVGRVFRHRTQYPYNPEYPRSRFWIV